MLKKIRAAHDNPIFIVDFHAESSSCSIKKVSSEQPMATANAVKRIDANYKILLLGDSSVGKTSLKNRILGENFRFDMSSTIGTDFVDRTFQIENARVNLQIWDTAGQRNFRTINRNYYSGTKAFVLVYDVTNHETFRLIEQFRKFIDESKLDTQRQYLVANKIDLVDRRQIDRETGEKYALRNSLIYFETSCKTGENVFELFEQIASNLVRHFNPKCLTVRQPKIENFAFRYDRTLPRNEQLTMPSMSQSVQKKKHFFSFLSYDSIDSDRPSFCSRCCCCCCWSKN